MPDEWRLYGAKTRRGWRQLIARQPKGDPEEPWPLEDGVTLYFVRAWDHEPTEAEVKKAIPDSPYWGDR
jgi:hypothetical protein